jgi:hypothetical protein
MFQTLLKSALTQAGGIHRELEDDDAFPSSPSFIPVFDACNLNSPSNMVKKFSEITSKPITLHRPRYNMKLDAVLEQYKNHIDITYHEKHNNCWARYYVCKELAHLLIYNCESKKDASFCTATFEDVVTNLEGLLNPSYNSQGNHQNIAENVAYYVAVELLIPTIWVDKLKAVRDSIAGRPEFVGTENKQLAFALRVPEKVVEFRLDHPHCKELYY